LIWVKAEHPGCVNLNIDKLLEAAVRKLMLASTIVAMGLIGVAHADTKDALREFGWEGTWSQDCSVPNILREGTTAILARSYDVIPTFGSPTRTIELVYERGPLSGTKSTTVYTVTSAKIVADNKLLMVSVDRSVNVESVLTLIGGKLVALRSVTSGIADREMPADILSDKPLKAGDHFSYISAADGISLSPSGTPRGAAVLEKCRD
jgi:hypothetical protein